MPELIQKVHFNDAFLPFFETQKRYAILYGGSGSSKSVSTAQKVIMRCLNETDNGFRHKIAVFRKFRTSIKRTVFDNLKGVCNSFGISDYVTYNETNFSIKFWNGAEIFCGGLDDPEKVKSIVSTSIWVEEATEIEEADFEQLDLRLRGISPYYKQIILSYNPVDETHWIKRKFFDQFNEELTFIMHSTYLDNHFIDEQYKKVLEERFKYDENQYRIYVKGEWGRIKTGSEYYFNFKHEKHVSENVKYIDGLPLHISFDFNVNPYISAIIAQIIRRVKPDGSSVYFVHVIDEFALKNPYNTTERLCEHIIDKYKDVLPKYGCRIYGDASGRNRGTRGSVTDYDIIEHLFKRYMPNDGMLVPKSNPMIKKRRNFINKVFFEGFNIKFQIAANCKYLINDITVAIEEQDGSKKKIMAKDSLSHVVYEKSGHHADCNDYFLCAAFEKYYLTM